VPDRKSVVITGASAGVGRAAAREFASRGWNVGLVARGAAGLEAAAADVEDRGGRALVLAADVADPVAVDAAAEAAVAAWGPINVWINAAMATVLAPVRALASDEVRRVTEVTYLGQVHGVLSALPRMAPHGVILSVGSALAYRGIPLQAPYCAAKFAVRGFLDALRAELIHERSSIRVVEAHLPAVNTPQFDWARNKMARRPQPVPPIYQPDAVARALWRAARDAPREVWIGASAAKAIVGDAVAPGLVDRLLASQAYAGQQEDAPALRRPDNLFSPLDEVRDYGAQGRFASRASAEPTTLDPARLRVAALALFGAVAIAVLARARSRDRG
jgi:NAD(P)-dependent dehydrogenase (short-subunit alcohol dehydrogenase family)